MNEVMYEVPSDETIARCIITKDAVLGTGKPVIECRTQMVGSSNEGGIAGSSFVDADGIESSREHNNYEYDYITSNCVKKYDRVA